VSEVLRPESAVQMAGGIRVAIRVTFKTDHPPTRPFRPAVFRLVELLLRERRHQESQSLQLLGIEDAVEQLEEILNGHQLALRDIAQVRPGGEKHRRRKLGQEVVREVKIEVK